MPDATQQQEEIKYEIKSVSLHMLEEGDLIIADVYSKGDQLLVGKGQVLSTPMIQKLRQINKVQHFAQEVEVKRQIKET